MIPAIMSFVTTGAILMLSGCDAKLDAIFHDLHQLGVNSQWCRHEKRDVTTLLGRILGDSGNVFLPMPTGQEKKWADNDLLGSCRQAGSKRVERSRCCQFHMSRLDNFVIRQRAKQIDEFVQAAIAFFFSRAVIDDHDSSALIIRKIHRINQGRAGWGRPLRQQS